MSKIGRSQGDDKAAFGSRRKGTEFAEAILACEDDEQVDARQVILAASSPFFQNLLKMNKHPHPLIYMRGVKSEDLGAIIDFLYLGEANVSQDNLDSFLAIAEELQLKGLMASEEPQKTEVTKTNDFKIMIVIILSCHIWLPYLVAVCGMGVEIFQKGETPQI